MRRRRKPMFQKTENFRLLDPDDPKTKNIIDAVLDARDPVPWTKTPDIPPRDKPPLAKLADRIWEMAERGRTVHLTPETAKKVAISLYRTADGAPWAADDELGHRVIMYETHDSGQVLACCINGAVAEGAYEAAVKAFPGRRIAQRWSMFTPRKNFK